MVFGTFTRRATQTSASASAALRSNLRSASTAATAALEAQAAGRGASSLAASAASRRTQTRATPEHYANDVTGVVAGVAIVGAIVGVGKMWWDASSTSSAKKYPVAFEEIPQEDVAEFFKELILNVQSLFKQIPEIENAMRTYMKSNNIELDDAQFKQALMQQLFQMMEGLEQEVVAKRQWSRRSLEVAFEKYADDAEILALQQELQQIMQSVFPAPEPVEIPDNLTPEVTLDIFTSLVNGMETALRDMLNHAKSEGITDAKQAMEEFQHLYLEHVEQISNALMKTHGITQEVFTAALQKAVQENDQFRQKVEAIYAKQAKTFRSLGLDVEEP